MAEHVDSASDDRTANNAVRHQYRVLTEAEKEQMAAVKDAGAALLKLIEDIREQDCRLPATEHGDVVLAGVSQTSRMLDIAATRAEEAVMWAVKHITA